MEIKRFAAVLAGLVMSFTMAFAQNSGTLKVLLKDATTDEAIGFATVSVTKTGNTKPYKYALSSSEGAVTIEKVAAGKYTFKAELLGYKPFTKEIEMKGDLDLGTVKMELDQEVLNAASVTAAGNPIIIKKDTVEFNATSFKTTDNDVLADLLKKLPGVEVSEDGTVTYNGESIPKITIDGKTFFLDDPQLATKNIPAKMIDKVKVVRKKSEQAEFTGIDDGNEETIIDLTVQKGMMNGLIGNVSIGGGHDVLENSGSSLADNTGDWRYQGGAFIGKFTEGSQISFILNGNNTNNRGFSDLAGNMMQGMRGGGGGMGRGQGGWGGGNGITRSWMAGLNGAWDLFDDKMQLGGNYVYNNSNRTVQEKSLKTTYLDDGTSLIYRNGLDAPGVNITNTYGNRFGMRLEHKFSENTSILFQPQVNFGGGNYSEFSDFETMKVNGSATSLTNKGFSNTTGENKNWSTSGFFLFRQRLGMPGRTLSFMGNYSLSNNDLDGYNQSLTETYKGTDALQDIVNQRIDQYSKGTSLSGRLVYTEPLGGGFYASANYSYRWSRNQSVKDTYNSGTNVVGINELIYNTVGESRDVTYSSEIVNQYTNQSAGLDLQYQKDKLHAQVGISFMPTKTHNETTSAGVLKEYDSNVVNWAPSAMLWYDVDDNTNMRLFYRGQSAQPSTSQLMPVPDNSNPLNISLGNPSLTPYFNHNLNGEFRMTNKQTFSTINVGFGGGLVQDPIVSALWYDGGGVQYTMPLNGPSSGNANLRLNISTPIARSNFSIYTMTFTNYSQSSSYVGKSTFDMSSYLDEEGVFTDYDKFKKDYLDEGGRKNFESQFTENKTQSWNLTERLRLTYRNDVIEVTAGGRTRMSKSWYTLENAKNLTTWSNQLNGSVNWTAPAGFGFKTDANYNWYRGYTTPQDSEIVINAEISKLLFDNKLTVALRGYDLLNQSKNINVTDASNYHQETWNNTLGRYIILSLTYRFGSFGSGSNRMRMGGGGPMGGRGPMGPPPGR